MISDKAKIALLKAAPKLSHIELIELVIEECQQSQRQWVGLDNDDLVWIYSNSNKVGQAISNTEAKLKEKNT